MGHTVPRATGETSILMRHPSSARVRLQRIRRGWIHRLHPDTGNGRSQVRPDGIETLADRRQGLLAGCERQIGEVDVYRQTRQIAQKQVDRGAALQGELFPPGDMGQHLDDQRRPTVERIASIHASISAR